MGDGFGEVPARTARIAAGRLDSLDERPVGETVALAAAS
jgi:hypothetical protein